MDALAFQLTFLTSSEVALLMVALLFAVLAPAWTLAAVAMPSDRRAAGWWAAHAAGNALALLLVVTGMHFVDAPARAAGNVAVVLATIALQRGVWCFTGQRAWTRTQAALVGTCLALALVAARDADWVPVRIGGICALGALVYLWLAGDVWRHVRAGLHRRWAALVAAPLLLHGLMLALRALRALESPETVVFEVEQSTVLGLGSVLTGLVAGLLLQMVLVALLVSRLIDRLERLSRHDALTGLLNRRAIDELLLQEEHRARRFVGQPAGRLALLMIDIDHFKQLNDAHGHALGDRALQHLAAVLGAQLRDIDHLARWGGEEFLALLPATSGAEALVLARRLCERLRGLPLSSDSGRLALTASIGVADWQGPQDSVPALLRRADDALYRAKRAGRDQAQADPGVSPLGADPGASTGAAAPG